MFSVHQGKRRVTNYAVDSEETDGQEKTLQRPFFLHRLQYMQASKELVLYFNLYVSLCIKKDGHFQEQRRLNSYNSRQAWRWQTLWNDSSFSSEKRNDSVEAQETPTEQHGRSHRQCYSLYFWLERPLC